MSSNLILHHYDSSPYAEKIRLMFGLANLSWQSLLSPVWLPRPNVDPLAGGYRRIPAAQIGADIFCDSDLIAKEIASLAKQAELNPENASPEAKSIAQFAEGEAFFAAVSAVPPLRLLSTMLLKFGPIGAFRFIKDRGELLKGSEAKRPNLEQSQALIEDLIGRISKQLDQHEWLDGNTPSAIDFSVYHPLWLHVNCSRRQLQCDAKVQDWFQRVAAIGHGQRVEISQADAFSAARDAQPREISDSAEHELFNKEVAVSPSDYGFVPVQGKLVAVNQERIIVARDTEDFGLIHVHFPRENYSINAQG